MIINSQVNEILRRVDCIEKDEYGPCKWTYGNVLLDLALGFTTVSFHVFNDGEMIGCYTKWMSPAWDEKDSAYIVINALLDAMWSLEAKSDAGLMIDLRDLMNYVVDDVTGNLSKAGPV